MRLLYEPLTDIPQSFTEVEYLEGTGTQYIDTGYNINTATDEVETYFQLITTDKYKWLMGEHDNGARFGIGSGDGTNLRNIAYGASTYKVNDTQVYNNRHVFTANSNGVYLDGTQVHNFENFSSTSTVYLFNLNISGAGNGAFGKIWRYTHKRNGILIRDFVPCLDNNNVPCMYDKVEGKAYYNAGTGTFSYGRKIIPVEYLESSRTQYVNTGISFPNGFRIKGEVSFNQVSPSCAVFGAWGTSSPYYRNFFGISQLGCYTGFGGSSYQYFGTATTNKKYSFNIRNVTGSEHLELDGVVYPLEIEGEAGTYTSTSAYIFAFHKGSGAGEHGAEKLYWLKAYNENDVLVGDYIPCKDENGVGYIFDKISHSVLLNAGTGSFTFGKILPKKKLRLIKESKRRLPKGFTEVEYLESTGTQYIDTGYIPSNTTGQYARMRYTTVNNGVTFGGMISNNRVVGPYYAPNSSKWYCGWGSNEPSINATTPTTSIMYDLYLNFNNDRVAKANDIILSSSLGSISGNYPSLTLFRRNYSAGYGYLSGKIYKYQITEGTKLVRDYIPCLNSSNVPCMYDLVEGKPYYNAGTGTFSYGHTITPVEYLESTGTQYIDTGVKPTDTIGIYGKFFITNQSDQVYAGWKQDNVRYYAPYCYSSTQTAYGWNSFNSVNYTLDTTKIHKGWLNFKNDRVVKIDDYILDSNLTTLTNVNISQGLLLFGYWGEGVIQKREGRIYSLQISRNADIIRDYIPCKDENGVGYMFDKVTHTLYANSGTGAFVVGNEIKQDITRFLMDGGRRLPKGYTEVEYIQSTGSQYIMSGLSMQNGFRIKGSLSIDDLSVTGGVFGCYTNSSPYYRNFFDYTSAKNWLVGYGGGAYQYFGSNVINTVYNFDVCNVHGKEHLEVNGTEYSFSPTGSTGNFTNLEMSIFALNISGTINNIAKIKLYRLEVYDENGVLVRSYLPCLDRNNVPCLFDLVENKTYYNAGTGTFSYGHAITPVKYLQSSGTQYIDTGYTSNNIYANSACEVMCETSDLSNRIVGCGGLSDNNKNISLSFSSGGYVVGLYGDRWTSNIFAYSTNTKYKIKFEVSTSQQKLYVNDNLIETTTYSWNSSNNYPLRLFKTNADTYTKPTKIYGFKLWISGSLVKDLIPVKDENNVGYLLDLVTHTLYANAGTGSFIIG